MKVLISSLILMMAVSHLFSLEIDTWERRYGDEMRERGKQIVRMNDETYLINANKIVDQYGFTNLIWLISVDQNGDSLWTKVVGDSMLNMYINDISPGNSEDIYVASGYDQGGLGQTAFVSKKTSSYEEIWTKTYTNLPSLSVGVSKVVCTADSGCVAIVHISESFEGSSDQIDKIDYNGQVTKSYYPSYEINDSTSYWPVEIRDVLPVDGGYLAVVSKILNYETYHHFVLKLDNELSLIWEREYSVTDIGYSIRGIESSGDGNYLIIEEEKITKIDPDANLLWPSGFMNNLRDVKESIDGDYFVAGYSNTYKVDDSGNILWSKDFGFNSIVPTDDGGCLALGTKLDDVWICKFDQDGNYVNINNFSNGIDGYELHQNYPNPFNPETTIRYSLSEEAEVKLTVFDITGREVAELVSGSRTKGNHSVNFNAENLTSGIYFLRLSVDGKAVQSKKMMMLK